MRRFGTVLGALQGGPSITSTSIKEIATNVRCVGPQFAPGLNTPSFSSSFPSNPPSTSFQSETGRGFASSRRGSALPAPISGDVSIEERKKRFLEMIEAPPQSLEVPESLWRDDSRRKLSGRFGGFLGDRIHKFATSFSDAKGWKAGHGLHLAVKRQSFQFGDLIPMAGLPDSFFSKFQLMSLHMWLVCRRLRGEGKPGKALVDKIHYIWLKDNEWLVYYEGVRVRFSRTMQELEKNFFGLAISCDCAIDNQVNAFRNATEPESLADVIHRNVCQGQGDRRDAELLARYARRELECLMMTPTEAIFEGRIKFSEAFRPLEEQASGSMVYSENKGVFQFALERLGLRKPVQLEEVASDITMKPRGGAGAGAAAGQQRGSA